MEMVCFRCIVFFIDRNGRHSFLESIKLLSNSLKFLKIKNKYVGLQQTKNQLLWQQQLNQKQ
jgi:hypothetical protein